jgi:membrane-bound lytic murein transglycosylase B
MKSNLILLSLSALLLCGNTSAVFAQEVRDDFATWKASVKVQAIAQGVSEGMFDEAMKGVKPNEKIVKLDGQQPHRTITFSEYQGRVISRSRVKRGIKLLRNNRKLLNEIGKKYGVQPRFIVALWGIETDYGRNTGGFYVPAALATLAYDGRRAEFFTKELIHSLKILEEKHISIKDMKGSWAGAMGQSQFMPSSFFNFAVDHNNDGKRDIWQTRSDVFASIANYLSSTGWDQSTTWGRKVSLPEGFDVTQAGSKNIKIIADWQNLGVRKADGSNLPNRKIEASVVLPGGELKNAYMVYGNYHTLLDWNRSLYFATSVSLLSDQIGGK